MLEKKMKDKELSVPGAIWSAFRGASIAHHPRIPDTSGELQSMASDQVLAEIGHTTEEIDAVVLSDADDASLKRARESLNEVKSLTEYEDQKATRLLTIVSFLAALAGVLFTRFAEMYPLYPTLDRVEHTWMWWLVAAAYVSFGAFAVTAVCGAMVVFHATQVSFVYPRLSPPTVGIKPRSYLFYSGILAVRPSDWARSFLNADPSAPRGLNPFLATQYFKSYVSESYLVAAKVADKLRLLRPAQKILSFSVRLLLIWLIVVVIVFFNVRGGSV